MSFSKGACSARGHRSGARNASIEMASYYVIPWLLVVLSVALVALIYWGSLVEERRNRQPGR